MSTIRETFIEFKQCATSLAYMRRQTTDSGSISPVHPDTKAHYTRLLNTQYVARLALFLSIISAIGMACSVTHAPIALAVTLVVATVAELYTLWKIYHFKAPARFSFPPPPPHAIGITIAIDTSGHAHGVGVITT